MQKVAQQLQAGPMVAFVTLKASISSHRFGDTTIPPPAEEEQTNIKY